MDAGEEFGRYRLDRLIGRGGMGEVWDAWDTEHARRVAVKRLPRQFADDDEYQRRFRRESQLAARLRDPHVVPIHDFGEIDGQLYLDMRLIEGDDLERVLASDGPLPPARAVAIAAQVASALAAAHAEGLVHRDVKPSNVLLDRSAGGDEFAYLADFGISRSVADDSGSTSAGSVVGTLEYMAPEQFEGRPTAQSDVYSLTCLLYRCLTGSVPFPGGGLPALMHAHLTADPPAPSEHATAVPTSLDTVVRRGLAKTLDERYASPSELITSARDALDGQSPATTPADTVTIPDDGVTTPADTVTTPADTVTTPYADTARAAGTRRRPALLVGGVAVAALLVVGLAVAVVVSVSPRAGDVRDGSPSTLGVGRETAPHTTGRSVDRPRLAGVHPVPNGPETVAFSPDGAQAYVTGSVGDSVLHVLDTTSGALLRTVRLPGVPRFVAVSPRDGQVFVSLNDLAANALVVASVDPATGTVNRTIPTGQPSDRVTGQTWLFTFAVSADGTRLYVPHHNVSVVSVLDTLTGSVIAQVPVPASPHGVSLSPDGRFAYVAIHEASQIVVLDTATNGVVATIGLAPHTSPHSLAVSPDGRVLQVVNFDGNSLTAIDTATDRVLVTYPVGSNPQSLAFAGDGAHSYTVNNTSGTVSTIDVATHTVSAVNSVGAGASMVAVSPDGRHAFVTSRDAGLVSSLDLDG